MSPTTSASLLHFHAMKPWKDEAEMLKAIAYADATHRMEGLELTPEQKALALQMAKGELTEDEFRARADAIAKKAAAALKAARAAKNAKR